MSLNTLFCNVSAAENFIWINAITMTYVNLFCLYFGWDVNKKYGICRVWW